jgi:hypothetical protein
MNLNTKCCCLITDQDSCPDRVMQDFEQMADCLIQFHDPTAGKCIDVRSSARDTFANEIADVYNGYLSTVKSNDKEDPVYMGEFTSVDSSLVLTTYMCTSGARCSSVGPIKVSFRAFLSRHVLTFSEFVRWCA